MASPGNNCSRKFKPKDFFKADSNNYFLLPFRFTKISPLKELIVNEVGDFLIVPIGTSAKIARRQISKDEPIYQDLITNFFISEKSIPDLIDVLATRYRTRKSFLYDFTSLHIFVITLGEYPAISWRNNWRTLLATDVQSFVILVESGKRIDSPTKP